MKVALQISNEFGQKYYIDAIKDRLKLLDFLLTDKIEDEQFEQLKAIVPIRDIYRILDQAIGYAEALSLEEKG